MKRVLKRAVQVLVFLVVVGAVVGAWAYRQYVVLEPGPEFDRTHVLGIIAQESPVYYRDGVTPMGVFFDQDHRTYVSYDDLPPDWVGAIIASEDGNFWTHPGVDPKHVIRAMGQNVQAGSVVAGGSTLTQQTAKNLFYRPDRSLRAKAVELVDALRLEAHFSKEEILEFYANQFHVSANGRGIGIAARYFFDKSPDRLSTKECAFIAGMVKAPSRYNPFIGQTEERRELARKAAEDRTAYVLRRMVATGYIPEGRREAIAAEPLQFRRGAFRYDRSVVLDEVQRRLEQPEFVELFERAGIDNPSTAGLRIITTVDQKAERAATYALWHHLTELGGSLEQAGASALQLPESTQVEASPDVSLVPASFSPARVISASESLVRLDFGGRSCDVDAAGIERIATAVGDTPAEVAAALAAGRFVLASVRPNGKGCDLELRPGLQGAVLVLENGDIRAMVGGNDNRHLNRVTSAARQFGSTWKPLLFETALELGWLPTDVLDNRRNVFPFRDVWYYPRSDHASDPFLSMTATGARSENLATVWLMAHLLDRVDDDTLRALAREADLWQREGETVAAFGVRMRDEESLKSSRERFPEYAFTRAQADVIGQLGTSRHPEDALAVRSLLHGYGVSAERARVSRTQASAERESRLIALENNFLSLEERASACLTTALADLYWEPISQVLACGRAPAGFEPLPPEALAVAAGADVASALSEDGLDDLLIDGRLHYGTLRRLRVAMEVRSAQLAERDPWDPETLLAHPDWRTLVGLRTFVRAVRDAGVESPLPENLTLPLGAADVSLVEMAGAYQGMLGKGSPRFVSEGFGAGTVTGLRSAFVLPENSERTSLIAEIRDAGGNVIFRMRPAPPQEVDGRPGAMVGDILRNAVLHGTGRRAAAPEGLTGRPLVGKTGTTNDYRNAAFIGFVPVQRSGPATWGEAVTVAVYVGYDDNRAMRRGRLRVQGSNGALPAWLGTVRGMAEAGLLGDAGTAEYRVPDGLVRVEAPDGTGSDGEALSALRPVGHPPPRIVLGAGGEASAATPVAEAAPSGALVLPTDAEFGPPPPAEGVDPTAPRAVDEEPTVGEMPSEDLLLPD